MHRLVFVQSSSCILYTVSSQWSMPTVLSPLEQAASQAGQAPSPAYVSCAATANIVMLAVAMHILLSAAGGLYVRPQLPQGLLQYLLGAFSADTATRASLNVGSGAQAVDYRASCFCHKTVVDQAWICSVCLSIFCKANMKLAQVGFLGCLGGPLQL